MARVCSFLAICLLVFGEHANSSLIQGRNEGPIFTKDVPLPKDDTLETDVVNDKLENFNTILTPPETIATQKCAEIGEFCMNSSDCCSNLCLGYMKRCVSNSG